MPLPDGVLNPLEELYGLKGHSKLCMAGLIALSDGKLGGLEPLEDVAELPWFIDALPELRLLPPPAKFSMFFKPHHVLEYVAKAYIQSAREMEACSCQANGLEFWATAKAPERPAHVDPERSLIALGQFLEIETAYTYSDKNTFVAAHVENKISRDKYIWCASTDNGDREASYTGTVNADPAAAGKIPVKVNAVTGTTINDYMFSVIDTARIASMTFPSAVVASRYEPGAPLAYNVDYASTMTRTVQVRAAVADILLSKEANGVLGIIKDVGAYTFLFDKGIYVFDKIAVHYSSSVFAPAVLLNSMALTSPSWSQEKQPMIDGGTLFIPGPFSTKIVDITATWKDRVTAAQEPLLRRITVDFAAVGQGRVADPYYYNGQRFRTVANGEIYSPTYEPCFEHGRVDCFLGLVVAGSPVVFGNVWHTATYYNRTDDDTNEYYEIVSYNIAEGDYASFLENVALNFGNLPVQEGLADLAFEGALRAALTAGPSEPVDHSKLETSGTTLLKVTSTGVAAVFVESSRVYKVKARHVITVLVRRATSKTVETIISYAGVCQSLLSISTGLYLRVDDAGATSRTLALIDVASSAGLVSDTTSEYHNHAAGPEPTATINRRRELHLSITGRDYLQLKGSMDNALLDSAGNIHNLSDLPELLSSASPPVLTMSMSKVGISALSVGTEHLLNNVMQRAVSIPIEYFCVEDGTVIETTEATRAGTGPYSCPYPSNHYCTPACDSHYTPEPYSYTDTTHTYDKRSYVIPAAAAFPATYSLPPPKGYEWQQTPGLGLTAADLFPTYVQRRTLVNSVGGTRFSRLSMKPELRGLFYCTTHYNINLVAGTCSYAGSYYDCPSKYTITPDAHQVGSMWFEYDFLGTRGLLYNPMVNYNPDGWPRGGFIDETDTIVGLQIYSRVSGYKLAKVTIQSDAEAPQVMDDTAAPLLEELALSYVYTYKYKGGAACVYDYGCAVNCVACDDSGYIVAQRTSGVFYGGYLGALELVTSTSIPPIKGTSKFGSKTYEYHYGRRDSCGQCSSSNNTPTVSATGSDYYQPVCNVLPILGNSDLYWFTALSSSAILVLPGSGVMTALWSPLPTQVDFSAGY